MAVPVPTAGGASGVFDVVEFPESVDETWLEDSIFSLEASVFSLVVSATEIDESIGSSFSGLELHPIKDASKYNYHTVFLELIK